MLTADLQVHLWQLLGSDPVLAGMMGGTARIHDTMPPAPHYPLIVLGECSEADWSTDDGHAVAIYLTLRCWSRLSTRSEPYAIADRVRQICEALEPVEQGATRILIIRQVSGVHERIPAEAAYRSTIRLRALCEPVAG